VTVVATRPLWAGRSLALVGIVLLAFNLRTAVAAVSPIYAVISRDIPLGNLGIGFLGMLPPLAFAASGIVAPAVARRLGLEATLAAACAAMVAGGILRASAGNYATLVAGSVVLLAGMGFGNILLPPVIKRYFPDRIGLMTATYATLMAIGAAIPPLVAAPIAEATGWRISLGTWGLVAVAAVVPWFFLWVRRRADDCASANDGLVEEAAPQLVGRMWRSPVAWAITIAFAVPSFNVYAMFAWLPAIITDLTTLGATEAGGLLALFAIMGLPFALVVPLIAVRVRNVGWMLALGVAFFVTGYLGMLLAPAQATWLWVLLIGSGPIVFPLTLTLINLRTRTHEASVALSGFVQSIGYGAAALGPLTLGFIHDVTGSWVAPLIFLIGLVLVALIPAFVLARPRMVEDDLARPASN